MIDVFIVPVCEKKNDVEKVIKDFYRLIEWIGRMTIVMELLYIAPTKKYDLVVKYVFAKQYNKQVCKGYRYRNRT